MTEGPKLQWNNDEIAGHLKSAMDTLTPDIFDKIDLGTPQDYYREKSKVTVLYRRMRTTVAVTAACLCVAVMGAGVSAFQNSRVSSSIGIDVNPSIELSVNRNDKVLKAEALNPDAIEILDDMELKNVDLNIAVNAVIGSMVRHGYLEGVDNAILVTVSSDDKVKAAALRQDVVGDIENSLEEHKLQAVVYDQQASVTDEVKVIAGKYGISYGKAYFLQELVDENGLTEEDLKQFADMTMEDISREIADRSYNIRKDAPVESEADSVESSETKKRESTSAEASIDMTASSESTADTTGDTTAPTTQAPQTTPAPTPASATTAPGTTAESTEESTGGSKKAKIDYVDYDGGSLNVVFKDKVKWNNPTVSVKDENGESYSAKITDTSSDSCEISVSGLPGGMNCTFTLNGVAAKEGGSYSPVKGYFDTPDMSDDILPPETSEPTTPSTEPTTPASTAPAPTEPVAPAPSQPAETSAPVETTPAPSSNAPQTQPVN